MAIGFIVASKRNYEVMQWLVMPVAADEETCSAYL